MNKFKVGDTIEMLASCSGLISGRRYKLVLHNNELYAWDFFKNSGCHCKSRWKLVKLEPKKVEVYGISKFMDKINKK